MNGCKQDVQTRFAKFSGTGSLMSKELFVTNLHEIIYVKKQNKTKNKTKQKQKHTHKKNPKKQNKQTNPPKKNKTKQNKTKQNPNSNYQ